MFRRFITNELSFLLAVLTLIILSLIGNSSLIKESFLVETVLFFIVFGVIVFAAMRVVIAGIYSFCTFYNICFFDFYIELSSLLKFTMFLGIPVKI